MPLRQVRLFSEPQPADRFLENVGKNTAEVAVLAVDTVGILGGAFVQRRCPLVRG